MKKGFLAAGCWLLRRSPYGLATGYLLLATCCFASDDCIPSKPSPPRLVNNFSKEFPEFLSADEEQTLEYKLKNFSKETSNQIVIVIVDDLCGYDANEFSVRVGEQWGVGQGKFDNGVVIMLKPTGGTGQRDVYIAVGYGLEGVIPDITAKQIVSNEIIPQFENGKYYEALNGATDVLISLTKKEFSYNDYQHEEKEGSWLPFIIFFIIVVYGTIRHLRNLKRDYTITRNGKTYHTGPWGGSWGGGGWGGGGFSSGEFGGFGGGSFGGGGAGGKW